MNKLFWLGLLLSVHCGKVKTDVRKFSDNLMFGAATGAYQVEGAWDEDGKSESIWDHLTHTQPCSIKDCENGDIADDSYHQVERDVEMMRELGLQFYRFSISWTRILPTGFPDNVNLAGAEYYNKLIDEMLKYNIQPMVTLYHWDLPQRLQDIGGWTNSHVVEWFGDYARVAYEMFGDRVKYWITINEPKEVCLQGYGAANMAPLLKISGIAEYICAKNLLVAHARAYHIYDDEFKPNYGGVVGITLSTTYYEAESEEHVEAAEDFNQFAWGQYAHPIFSEDGDFPPTMKKRISEKSAEQGFFRSRLPEFTPEEVEYVKGTSDFFGVNHYTTNLVYRNESTTHSSDQPSYSNDLGATSYKPSDWPMGLSAWLAVRPSGFYNLLTKFRVDYNNPIIYITENGYSTDVGFTDDGRIEYHRLYLDAMLDAIEEGSDVRMYAAWSLMDNFEWRGGYTERFGLYQVDYDSPERTRTPRKSAFVYKEILRTRSLDFSYEPANITEISIDDGL